MSLSQPALPFTGILAPPRPKPERRLAAKPVTEPRAPFVPPDFNATPSWVTEALLSRVRFRGPVWEPCCGDGAMSKVFAENGYDVVSSDLIDRGFGTPGVDFLACQSVPGGCRSIVTNPPCGDSGSHAGQSRSPAAMLDFLSHAMRLTASVQGQLALLVRLQWLAGRRAADMMSSGPFSAVVVLNRRITWFDMGPDTKQAQHNHAWVVFDHAHPPGEPPAMLFA